MGGAEGEEEIEGRSEEDEREIEEKEDEEEEDAERDTEEGAAEEEEEEEDDACNGGDHETWRNTGDPGPKPAPDGENERRGEEEPLKSE